MATMSKPNGLLLQVLAILIFISSAFAAPSLAQLQDSFYVETDPNYGGNCDRELYQGVEILPKALEAFGDAWTLSEAGVELPINQINARTQNLVSLETFTRLRALLFMFFGIILSSTGQFSAESHMAYNNVSSEFQGVDALQTEPSDPFGFGLPKFRCLEDYAEFYRYLADDDGVEDPNLGLAAVHFDEEYSDPSLGFLPGLMYDYQFETYYRGTEDDPRVGLCDSESQPTVAWTNSISGPTTALYGITVCEPFFDLPSFADEELYDGHWTETSDMLIGYSGPTLLNEMLIMQSRTGAQQAPLLFAISSAVFADQNPDIGVIVQDPVRPSNLDWTSTDWSQWEVIPNPNRKATALADCVNLGLARPDLARKNAPNYVHFILCLAFNELDCTSRLPAGAPGS